jgi:hypothetical protein
MGHGLPVCVSGAPSFTLGMARTENQTLRLVAEAVAENQAAPLAARAPDEIDPPIEGAEERVAFSEAFRKEFITAFVSAAKAGAGRERERCATILGSQEAVGRWDAAVSFAVASDMTAAEAVELLADFPRSPSRFGFIGDVVGGHGLTFSEIVVGRNPSGRA